MSDNDPVGIILCARRMKILAEYSMEDLINDNYTPKYTYVIPNKNVLENELQNVTKKQKQKDYEDK